MLEDDTAQEGNLGLVYGLSTNNMNIENNATTTKIYFLPSVVLPTQITSSFSGSLIYQSFNLNCSLNSTSFICNTVFRGDTTSVEYTSTDGINYTRVTDTDMYEFSYGIELNRFRNWDDNFGYFLQVGGMIFNGLYKYTNNIWELAETQLTFSEASQLTKDIIGYGLNGVITGTLETLDTSDATAQASDIISPKTAYVDGEKIIGSFAPDENLDVSSTVSQQSDITIGDDGFGSQSLTFKGTQSGYYTPKYIKNVTPTVSAEQSMVANAIGLTAEKLVSGNIILGVQGTAQIGIDTSDADATTDDIVSQKTAYVNGQKITGTLIKTDFQLSDLQEQGIDISEAVSGSSFVSCNDTDTSICIYAPMNMCLGSNSYFPATMSNSDVVDAVGLTADKIVQGNTILGIIGTGGAGTEYEPLQTLSTSVNKSSITQENWVTLSGVVSNTGIVTENETTFVAGTTFANLANTIGLTADKIKKGETILGITGTYEGIVSEEEYQQAVDTTEQILGITDNQ